MIGSKTLPQPAASERGIFARGTLIKGVPAQIECVHVSGQTYSITRGPVTTVRLEDEWYEDQRDPFAAIEMFRSNSDVQPDIFTFWQRLPDVEPKYQFHQEWEHLAVLRVLTYEHWWNHQIKSRVRALIRKSEKEGIVVKETSYDDDFVRGMTGIFNESAIRQGRPFWHYGKAFDTVKEQFSRFVHREHMIAAYYRDEMIGLVMLGNAGRFGITGQIISSLKHRDKATNNALIAKAVEVCEKRQLPYLVYLFWSDDSLSEFKRRCGFEKTAMPRYYVPLTSKGRLALKCGVHRGWQALIPRSLRSSMKRLRTVWYSRQE
jgi:hypothetical protein